MIDTERSERWTKEKQILGFQPYTLVAIICRGVGDSDSDRIASVGVLFMGTRSGRLAPSIITFIEVDL